MRCGGPEPSFAYNGKAKMQPNATRRRTIAALAALPLAASMRAAAADPPVILILGDSISAAYGLPTGAGWTDLLQKRLDSRKLAYRVVNASISGDTTAGGRSRLPALLARHKPAIVVIELGGNDGLRGGSIASTRDNLTAMTKAAKAAGARPMLIGMRLPPNYGPAYTRQFEGVFTEVAKAEGAPLVPFFFEGFGEDASAFQADRIHPNEATQARLLDNAWPTLERMLARR